MSDSKKELAVALRRLDTMKRKKCFDPYNLESRSTAIQESVFADIEKTSCRFVVAGNQSGKSSIGAREISWLFENEHPYLDVKKRFGNTPLLIIMMGRVGEQVETELWARKIKPFLDPSTYKEVKTGSVIQRIEHKTNGNKIILMSHHNINEAREKAQTYTANYVWLDEMPGSVQGISLISELQLRVQANNGFFLSTFTPLVRNEAIKSMVENADPKIATVYRFGMLDNPIYKGREEEILARFKHLPDSERNARLLGEWYVGDSSVYTFRSEIHCENPEGYDPDVWRHIESVDPAASGKAGYILMAERPLTDNWYVIKADYVKGDTAKNLLKIFNKLTGNVNLIRRVCDPHETWFIKHAQEEGHPYVTVYKKQSRKNELIKQLQNKLNDNLLKISPKLTRLVSEFTSCQYSETNPDKIVNARSYHMLDALQYGVDNIPRPLVEIPPTSWMQKLRKDHKIVQEIKARPKRFKPRGNRWKRFG